MGQQEAGLRSPGVCPSLPQAVPVPTTFPPALILSAGGHGPAGLENQVVLLRSGLLHGLVHGMWDKTSALSPFLCPRACHLSATAAGFGDTGPGKSWPGQAALLFPSWDLGSALAPAPLWGGLRAQKTHFHAQT